MASPVTTIQTPGASGGSGTAPNARAGAEGMAGLNALRAGLANAQIGNTAMAMTDVQNAEDYFQQAALLTGNPEQQQTLGALMTKAETLQAELQDGGTAGTNTGSTSNMNAAPAMGTSTTASTTAGTTASTTAPSDGSLQISGGTAAQDQEIEQGYRDDLSAYSAFIPSAVQDQAIPVSLVSSMSGNDAGLTTYSFGADGSKTSSIQLLDTSQGQTLQFIAAHETDHAMSSQAFDTAFNGNTGAIEGTTDWLAIQSSGGPSGPSGYAAYDSKIQTAVNDGLISKTTLEEAYFSGNTTAIEQVENAYNQVDL